MATCDSLRPLRFEGLNVLRIVKVPSCQIELLACWVLQGRATFNTYQYYAFLNRFRFKDFISHRKNTNSSLKQCGIQINHAIVK